MGNVFFKDNVIVIYNRALLTPHQNPTNSKEPAEFWTFKDIENKKEALVALMYDPMTGAEEFFFGGTQEERERIINILSQNPHTTAIAAWLSQYIEHSMEKIDS